MQRSLLADTPLQLTPAGRLASTSHRSVGIVQVMVSTAAEVTTFTSPLARRVDRPWRPARGRYGAGGRRVPHLYLDESVTRQAGTGCRVIEISALVRELIQAL